MNLRSWGLGLVLASVIGCSSDDDPTPTDKCNTLIDQWCNKILDCVVQNGQLAPADKPAQLTQCKQEAGTALDCAAAVSVSSSYGTCKSDIDAIACSSVTTMVPPLPASCKGVILLNK